MPTKKKRVGFIPREEVMKIIDRLSKQNNLSISKIISILVEEALTTRGIYSNKVSKASSIYPSVNNDSKEFSKETSYYDENDKFSINTKLNNQQNQKQTTFLKQTNNEVFDLQTYKKFLSFLKFQEMIEDYDT